MRKIIKGPDSYFSPYQKTIHYLIALPSFLVLSPVSQCNNVKTSVFTSTRKCSNLHIKLFWSKCIPYVPVSLVYNLKPPPLCTCIIDDYDYFMIMNYWLFDYLSQLREGIDSITLRLMKYVPRHKQSKQFKDINIKEITTHIKRVHRERFQTRFTRMFPGLENLTEWMWWVCFPGAKEAE